ncbi:hypothetical protein LBMAG44_11730 [Gemmatimonadota bacterium]|nr:hypothetical protein LBMAG44_11730 [Gemmatimonadota bacterium]
MTAPVAGRRDDWRLWFGVPVGLLVLRLVALTWRFEAHGDAGWRSLVAAKRGVVLALWHGHLLPLAWFLRGHGMSVLVSEHRDGEIIARILQRLGYSMIRGSSTRGGARALVEMVRALKTGVAVCITPDGPKGPARKFSPGAAVAAQRSGVPIVTMFVTAERAWALNSWDRFMIPMPFAKIVLHFGEPTNVRPGTPGDAVADAPRFEALFVASNAAARG